MRGATLCLLLTVMLAAQERPRDTDLLKLTDELHAAIDAGDWKKAVKLSASLKEAVRNQHHRSLTQDGREQVDAILEWLPLDTETVIVAQEPFTLVEYDRRRPASAVQDAQSRLVGLLSVAEDGALRKTLEGRTLRLAVLAGRKFKNHSPGTNGSTPLGLIAFQGCAVYSFAKPVDDSTLSRPPDDAVAGKATWLSKGRLHDELPGTEPYTFLISQPRPDLILACNDRNFFSEVLSRMAAPQSQHGLPQDLPEWKLIDRTAPLWGLRHFRPERAAIDPTYPDDAKAIGVIIQLGAPSGRIEARSISSSATNPWKDLVENGDLDGRAHSRKLSDGVWEFYMNGNAEAAGSAVFYLMAHLGFAVYL